MNIKVSLDSIKTMPGACEIMLITLVTFFACSIVSIAGVADRTVSGTVKKEKKTASFNLKQKILIINN
jgi:hypothetical protein